MLTNYRGDDYDMSIQTLSTSFGVCDGNGYVDDKNQRKDTGEKRASFSTTPEPAVSPSLLSNYKITPQYLL